MYHYMIPPEISLLTPFPLPQTNTVVDPPAQSTVSPAPFALVAPLPKRDPIRAAGEWRDREAERHEKKHGKIHRPGVTWDLGEDPQSPPQVLPQRNFFAENLDVMVHRGCVIADEPATVVLICCS